MPGQDLLAFLEQPRKRLKDVAWSRQYGWESRNDYPGHRTSLKGLAVDWAGKTIQFPPGVPDGDRAILQETLFGKAVPQTGATREYLRRWFGKILELYRHSGTKFVFMRLPRGPIQRLDQPESGMGRWLLDLAPLDDVAILPEHLFDSLERPELYFDAIHFNAQGRAPFSALLARALREKLGPSHN